MRHPPTLLYLALLTALGPAFACDLDRPLADLPDQARLLEVAARLADSSDCRILLAPALARSPRLVAVKNRQSVGRALDVLSSDYDMNWRTEADGSIELVAYADAADPDLRSRELTIEDAPMAAVEQPSVPIDFSLLPSEQGPVLPRTTIGLERIEDEAIRDFQTALMRVPGVYPMAGSDVIRGVSSSRIPGANRASLITVDGVPIPNEASFFNRMELDLIERAEVVRGAVSPATLYGAGAGLIAMQTRAPDAEFGGVVRALDTHASVPHVAASTTTGFGLPGLQMSWSASGQIGADAVDVDQQPDYQQNDQVSMRFSWSSPEARHQLVGSFLDLNVAQVGGLEQRFLRCETGFEHCPRGADVSVSGGALSWQWRANDDLTVSVSANQSDTEGAILTADANPVRVDDPTTLVYLRGLDGRVDYRINDLFSASVGLSQSRRVRRFYTDFGFDTRESPESPIHIAAVDPLRPAYVRVGQGVSREIRLDQQYAELRFDDGEHWDAHIGLRSAGTEAEIVQRYNGFEESNCRIDAGPSAPAQTCTEALRAYVGEVERAGGETTDWLPQGALRYRFDEQHWLSLAWRESIVVSDFFGIGQAARTAEPITTTELTYSTQWRDEHELRARAWRNEWSKRNTSFNGELIRFESDLHGVDLEYTWAFAEQGEVWANAAWQEGEVGLTWAELIGAPELTAALGGRYRFDSGLYLGVTGSYAAEAYSIKSNGARIRLPSRTMVDARFGFRRGGFDASIYGTNLLDDEFPLEVLGTNLFNEVYYARGRVVGVELRYQF